MKIVGFGCKEIDMRYDSLFQAKQRCSSDIECTGILDKRCNEDVDGKQFSICGKDNDYNRLDPEHFSCVYKKIGRFYKNADIFMKSILDFRRN